MSTKGKKKHGNQKPLTDGIRSNEKMEDQIQKTHTLKSRGKKEIVFYLCYLPLSVSTKDHLFGGLSSIIRVHLLNHCCTLSYVVMVFIYVKVATVKFKKKQGPLS